MSATKRCARLGVALTLVLGAASARAEGNVWPDDFVTRVEATALVETLSADILASPSATLALDAWCGQHGLAPAGTKVVARLERGADVPATAEQRTRLDVGPDEPIKCRRVALTCGDHLLSVADNWYVPARLTPAMNEALETTDIAFGRAVLALDFSRRTFAVNVLWHPLPPHWEALPVPHFAPGATLKIPDALLEHRAVLSTKAGVPFSEVRETYQRALFDFPLPSEAESRPLPASIGAAIMAADGTVTLRLRAVADDGTIGEGVLTYRPGDKDYDEIIRHLGGLTPGVSKSVPPWP